MKNRPLVFQIWFFIAVLTAVFGIVLMLVLPRILGSFFTDEMFLTIESAQIDRFPLIQQELRDQKINRELGIEPVPKEPQDIPMDEDGNIRVVNHVVIDQSGYFNSLYPLNDELQSMIKDGLKIYREDGVTRFSYPYQEKTLYFSIKFGQLDERQLYVVSYMTNDYRDQLISDLLLRFILLIVAGLVIAWIPAIFVAKYLTKPLIILQSHVRNYAQRDLEQPVRVEQRDEIGQLAKSIEQMRLQLKAHDETQQSVLQHVSHELKTPVMVIQSYAQSIQDGMVQGERLQAAMAIVEKEAKRLEKRIAELLYMTKLDYLANHKLTFETMQLDEFVEAIGERFRWMKPDLDWDFELQPVIVQADLEQWQIVLENIFDNQLRYAQHKIKVKVFKESLDVAIMRIWNDGVQLEEGSESIIFESFRKGTNGKFGLGLVIVKRIAELHQVDVRASNEEQGVAFTFKFNLHSVENRV
jgi:two-component system sensor histidine kinase CssS